MFPECVAWRVSELTWAGVPSREGLTFFWSLLIKNVFHRGRFGRRETCQRYMSRLAHGVAMQSISFT